MRKIIYIMLCLPLLMTTACKDGTEVDNPSSGPITLLGNISSVGVETRGDGVVDSTNASQLLVNFARIDQSSTDGTYPLYSTIATALDATRAAGSGNQNITFSSAQQYLADPTYKSTKMIGWYPRAALASGVITYTLDGSTDVMLTNEVTGSSSAKFSDAAQAFSFAHQLTQLQFKVYAEDAAAATAWGTITSISVKSQKPTCTITLPTASVTTPAVAFSGTAADVNVKGTFPVTLTTTSAAAANSGYAMIPPVTAAAGATVVLHIVTSKGTKDVTLDASAGMLKSNAYVYTLKFTRTGISAAAGQVANWITGSGNIFEVDALTGNKIVNLSANESANSYIAAPGGNYKFKATVMGNGLATTGITPTAIAPVSASVLWQTSSGLISSAPTVTSDGYVKFSTVSGTEGNAVIAVKDASNNVLWSWHIWVANYNPNATTSTLNGNVFMDRNLGATTTTPATATTLGLMYQWGRKDPFPGSASVSANTEPTLFGEKTAVTKTAVSAASNLANSILNPLTFYTGTDWYQTGGTQNDNLWGASKTIYDPCPPGWHVPAFSGTTSPWNVLTSSNGGTWNSGFTWSSSYYPAIGFRDYSSGSITNVGSYGDYWSASVAGTNAYYLLFLSGYVYPSYSNVRTYGFGVRCIKN